MTRLARRNTNGAANLTLGLAQQLPFASGSFDTIVSTFPSEYIFDPRTLAEARRCLMDRGRLTVLPVAMPKSRALEWLYKVSGESPSESEVVVKKKLKEPFLRAGFSTEIYIVELRSSRLFIVVADKVLQLDSTRSAQTTTPLDHPRFHCGNSYAFVRLLDRGGQFVSRSSREQGSSNA